MSHATVTDFYKWAQEYVTHEEPKKPSFFLSPGVMVAGLFLVVLIGIVVWWFFARPKADAPAVSANPAAASQEKPSKPDPRPRNGEKVHYVTSNGTPVDAKSVKNKK